MLRTLSKPAGLGLSAVGRRLWGRVGLILLCCCALLAPVAAATVRTYDFTQGDNGWIANHFLANMRITSEGVAFDSLGIDPYFYGPAESYPAGEKLVVTVRMKSQADSAGELFYGVNFAAGQSVSFTINPDGAFHDYVLLVPAQEEGSHLRLDPAGDTGGAIVVASIKVETRSGSWRVKRWDFREGLQGWGGNKQTTNLQVTADGAEFDSTGSDPWFEGPAVDYPTDQKIQLTIRMRTSAEGAGQIFYGQGFTEAQSRPIAVIHDGVFHDYIVILTRPLGAGARLRLDPAAGTGHITVQSIEAVTLPIIPSPTLTAPVRPTASAGVTPQSLASGALKLVHYGQGWGGWVVQVADWEIASGHQGGLVGVVRSDATKWLDLKDAAFTLTTGTQQLTERAALSDGQGGTIVLTRTFTPNALTGTIDVTVGLTADRAEQFCSVPWLTLFPGLGTYGTQKKQGLFAGLEYLTNEASSSTADIAADVDEHVRRVPSPHKITFPLMSVVQNDRYLGLVWDQTDLTAAMYDTPDTLLGSKAQLMALWAPAVGTTHLENDLYAMAPFSLAAGATLSAHATVVGGSGTSVVPAIRHYVALRGLPALPAPPDGTFEATVAHLAGGWLDSLCASGAGTWQHAVWDATKPNYGAAADAPAFMRWLAAHTTDFLLASRLIAGAAKGEAVCATSDTIRASRVGHVSHAVPALLGGDLTGYLNSRRYSARDGLNAFDSTGILHYTPGTTDLGTTHFADHANGLAAATLHSALEGLSLTGDQTQIDKALGILDQETALYHDSEPRGAQTWEVPLHTPDVLASAYLVRCYLFGYKMTGRQDLLDEAVYWAWTGVPFVYLTPPTTGHVGVYSAIAVFGATQWEAPLWIGRPVQWCGLVYANALHELSLYDSSGPWSQIGKGITLVGLQHSYPTTDTQRQGLLPDSFDLIGQTRGAPPINPGTVQATLAQAFDKGRFFEFRVVPRRDWYVTAPCAINSVTVSGSDVVLALDGFGSESFRIDICRAPAPIRVQTRPVGSSTWTTTTNYTYNTSRQWLLINQLKGAVEVKITAATAVRGDMMRWLE